MCPPGQLELFRDFGMFQYKRKKSETATRRWIDGRFFARWWITPAFLFGARTVNAECRRSSGKRNSVGHGIRFFVLSGSLLSLFSQPVIAMDMDVEVGLTPDSGRILRLNLIPVPAFHRLSLGHGMHIEMEIWGDVARWFDLQGGEDLWEVGLTPVFRLAVQDGDAFWGRFRLQAGIGFHLLSHTRYDGEDLGSAFQFGDHIGLGYRFPKDRRWEAGYRFQHLSNGGLQPPNEGANFHLFYFRFSGE